MKIAQTHTYIFETGLIFIFETTLKVILKKLDLNW